MAKAAFSGLAAKLGDAGRKAFEAHKADEVEVGAGAECPPIPNGVARLVDIHFDEYKTGKNQGKLFCYMAGTVINPKFVLGADGSKIPAAGCRTNQTLPLCATTNTKGETTTLETNLARCMNEFKKLGLDLSGMGLDTWEAGAKALVESAPYFGFSVNQGSTTPEFPNPRTFHNWGLSLPDYNDETDPDAGVNDKTSDAALKMETKKAATTTAKPAANSSGKPPVKGAKKAEEVPFGDDLDMTADKADNGDEKAKVFLAEKAREVGCSDDEIENTADWQEVATMIREKEASPDSDTPDEEVDYVALGEAADSGDEDAASTITDWGNENEIDVNDHGDKSWADFVTFVTESIDGGTAELVPEKESVYKTKLPGAKKESQVEVTAVFEDKKICNVKSLDDNKSYKGIAWSSLSEAT